MTSFCHWNIKVMYVIPGMIQLTASMPPLSFSLFFPPPILPPPEISSLCSCQPDTYGPAEDSGALQL